MDKRGRDRCLEHEVSEVVFQWDEVRVVPVPCGQNGVKLWQRGKGPKEMGRVPTHSNVGSGVS